MARHSGFSLIEVLVSLVILTTGILGLARLQGTSLRNAYHAHLHSLAISLAHDMTERLRINRKYALHENTHYQIDSSTDSTDITIDCTSTICTDSEMAIFDINQWLQTINTLPNGKGHVSINPVARSAIVTVMWNLHDNGAADNECRSDSQTNSNCVRLISQP